MTLQFIRIFFSNMCLITCFSVVFSQKSTWERELIAVSDGSSEHIILGGKSIYEANWHQLPQPQFWQQIMLLSPDSVLINVASNRKIVGRMSNKKWALQSESLKSQFKDSIRNALGLSSTERIMVTTGKNDFYRFDLVYESLSKGVNYFDEYGVDPWFAQSILLIESPGQLKKSSAGAYGPFQLMPSVARSMGLTVTKTMDERDDFRRSAYASAQLLKRVCIPSALSIASKTGLQIDENAIWFRLLVLHVYHAGAMNVKAVVEQIGAVKTGEELIQKMWVTTAASFGNSSQNYSQLALAAHLQLANIIEQKKCSIYNCSEF